MIVLWRGNGVHVLRADIGPINLIYWAFNGIPSAFTKSYILQYMQYMHYMRSKSSHTFILTVVRKVGLGARMNISWPRSYFIYHIIYVHDDVESSTYVNLFISQGKVCV